MSPLESMFHAAFQASAGLLTLTVKAVKNRRKTSMLTDTALRKFKPKSMT